MDMMLLCEHWAIPGEIFDHHTHVHGGAVHLCYDPLISAAFWKYIPIMQHSNSHYLTDNFLRQ